jgi:pimeloyl-ACP methyl ester carboxylesterase
MNSVTPTGPAPRSSAQPPGGFTQQKVVVGSVGIDYVIGGHGPTLVLLHGYPQSWFEWRHVLPALAEHYTVIAPSLRGAGHSDAPPTGYDKKTLAADIHELLVQLGHDKDIRIVGHDIGLMVAYSYAAAHPQDVVKLVLSEAFIPDPSIYTFSSLTEDGPGPWHFGFFLLTNGFPEQLIAGNETVWVDKFIDSLEVVKRAVTPDEVEVYAGYLREPGHLKATLEWFRTWPQDMVDNAEYQKTKLAMPVLAIGAEGSLGDFVATNARGYASDVADVVIPNSATGSTRNTPPNSPRPCSLSCKPFGDPANHSARRNRAHPPHTRTRGHDRGQRTRHAADPDTSGSVRVATSRPTGSYWQTGDIAEYRGHSQTR